MNVSGHRLSTMELGIGAGAASGGRRGGGGRQAARDHGPGRGLLRHPEEGQLGPSPRSAEELRKWVAHEIGSFAKPEQIRFTDALPKTRSGKIMRRLLRES